MRILVTGATGFIGSAVAQRLRGRGDDVVAYVRNPSTAQALAGMGCALAGGDLADSDALTAAMRGSDAVVHLAGIYEIGVAPRRRQELFDVNVLGTERVLDAAEAVAIARTVHVSTINAFGNTFGEIVDERVRHHGRYVSLYDETKHLAHEAARQRLTAGLPGLIVQPGAVYGPGDHSQLGGLIERFVAGRLPAVPFADLGISAVHRDDVAEGIVAALDHGSDREEYVLGGEITTVGGVVDCLAKLTGRRAPRLRVPLSLLRVLAPAAPLLAPLGVPPNLREVIRASAGVTYWARWDKAARAFGYQARSLADGLRDTLAAMGVQTWPTTNAVRGIPGAA